MKISIAFLLIFIFGLPLFRSSYGAVFGLSAARLSALSRGFRTMQLPKNPGTLALGGASIGLGLGVSLRQIVDLIESLAEDEGVFKYELIKG